MSNLGDLIETMIKDLQARNAVPMSETRNDLAIRLGVSSATLYKWQGVIQPDHDQIERLLDIGVMDARMDSDWANAILKGSLHPRYYDIFTRHFAPSLLPVRNNLPRKPFTKLVGRDSVLARIYARLEPREQQAVIPIEGVGGIGKTALALEVGWTGLKESLTLPPGRRFEAIVWTTAKKEILQTNGIVAREPMLTNLVELYRIIGNVLEDQEVIRNPITSTVLDALRRNKRVLLILDNLEDIDNREILRFLRDVPPPHKVLVTLRQHEDLPAPIRLNGLDDEAMRAIVTQASEARELGLTEEQITNVVRIAHGLPLAATLAAGLIDRDGVLAHGNGSPEAPSPLLADDSDLVLFLYRKAREDLSPDALRTWYALSFFAEDPGASLDALASVLNEHDREACQRQVHQLYVRSLVSRNNIDGPYAIRDFTHQYCAIQVAKDDLLDPSDPNRVLDPKARTRWLDWYSTFAVDRAPLMAQDERKALDETNREWSNVREVFRWCMEHDTVGMNAYERLKNVWFPSPIEGPNFSSPILTCAEVNGHWPDCLDNLRWLSEKSAQQNDIPTMVAAMSQMGRLYALKDQINDAARALPDLVEVRSYHQRQVIETSLYLRVLLNYVMLEFPRRDEENLTYPHKKAHDLLVAVESLLGHPHLSDLDRGQLSLRYLFYRAKLLRAEGNLTDAERLFTEMVEASKRQEGNRLGSYGLRYLADICMKRDDLAAARDYFGQGLDIAVAYHDILQMARLEEALSKLNKREAEREEEQQPAKLDAARQAARESAENFDILDMTNDAQRAREFAEAIVS